MLDPMLRAFAGVALAASFAAPSTAGDHCVTTRVPAQTTNWSTSVVLPRFDSGLGRLESVQVSLSGRIDGTVGVENFAASAATYVQTVAAQLQLARPDATVLVQVSPAATFTDDLGAFDGTLDFAGSSGASHSVVNATAQASVSTTSPSDLVLFGGAAGNPGSITLLVSATSTSTSIGPGAAASYFNQTAGVPTIEVCYQYAVNDGGTFCAGDSIGGACPCSNAGQNGHGCINSLFPSGALLGATGTASVSNDSLRLGAISLPNSPVLFFQGTAPTFGSTGVAFGDGVRCVGGTILRLGTKTSVANASSYPQQGDVSISVRGLVPAAGGVRHYQAWYRNGASFCTPDAFNLTNGLILFWTP